MKKSEAVLSSNPKHAEAMVWHGSGTFFLSGVAARTKISQGGELYKKGSTKWRPRSRWTRRMWAW